MRCISEETNKKNPTWPTPSVRTSGNLSARLKAVLNISHSMQKKCYATPTLVFIFDCFLYLGPSQPQEDKKCPGKPGKQNAPLSLLFPVSPAGDRSPQRSKGDSAVPLSSSAQHALKGLTKHY